MTEPGDPETEQTDPLMESAVFGREVQEFLEHDRIGRAIVARAKSDMEAAQNELTDIDAEDAKAIRAAQFKYQVANKVVAWLASIIVDGDNAANILRENG